MKTVKGKAGISKKVARGDGRGRWKNVVKGEKWREREPYNLEGGTRTEIT